MSISNEKVAEPYAGDGSSTDFPITFDFQDDSEIVVDHLSALGVETRLSIGAGATQYTLTGSGPANPLSDTVVLNTALAVGARLVVRREVPFKQTGSYSTNGPFPQKTHERLLDKIVRQVQQLYEKSTRGLHFKNTSLMSGKLIDDFVTPEACLVIKSDLSGLEEGPTVSQIEGAEAAAAAAAASAASSAAAAAASAADAAAAAASVIDASADAAAAAASAAAALASELAAAASAAAALTSENNAETAETNAELAETNAEAAQAAAEAARDAAIAARDAALTAETNAETAETNAETAETNAETAETNAAASAAAAAASAAAAAASVSAATGLAEYADDAAFVSANGAAENGDIYYNTTIHAVKHYMNGAWRIIGAYNITLDPLYNDTLYWGTTLPAIIGKTTSAAGAFAIKTDDLNADTKTLDISVTSGHNSNTSTGAARTGHAYYGSGYVTSGNGHSGIAQLRSGHVKTGTSGDTKVGSGDAQTAGGSSGHTVLDTGSIVSGGTRGKIKMKGGSEGTSGMTWTSVGTDGEGEWKPAGGGGAGGLRWYFDETSLAPASRVLANGLEVFDFSHQSDQFMWAQLIVPASYVGGNQIFLKDGIALGPLASANNVLFRATSYLIKPGVNIGNALTGYDSTNAQQAMNGTANFGTDISDIDLTNAAGEINGVAVAAGNKILIKLRRLASSETSQYADTVSLVKDSFEPDYTE